MRAPGTTSWWWESAKDNAPARPGALLFYAHRKEVVEMKQLRLSLAITVEYRFVLALSLGVVAMTATVLLLKK